MELRLLGPLELLVDGVSVTPRSVRQRVVLAVLAVNANRVVPVEQLVDAVWGAQPPPTARSQIQICISVLRRLLGDANAIQTKEPGYRLEAAQGAVDCAAFDARVAAARVHVEAGHEEEASQILRSGLELWYGPALAGVPGEVVERVSARLAERKLAAEEEYFRLALNRGRHLEVLDELRTLADANPYRERLHSLLMLALYRAGRQAEALEVGREARSVLVSEVGVEPGQEIQELVLAILNQDAALVLEEEPSQAGQPSNGQQPSPGQLPAGITDFVRRDGPAAEIKRVLLDRAESSVTYGVRIVVVSGPGGVGKSSLALRAAHEVSSEYPDGQLYVDMRDAAEGGQPCQVLIRFLRALGVPGNAVPDTDAERADLYRSLVAQQRLLVMLDDVLAEEQVLPLLPGGPECAVIVTSRSRLSGLPGAHRIELDLFDTDQSIELLTNSVGEQRILAERESASELMELCGRLPLALRIAGARLVSRPHWRLEKLVRRLRDETHRLDELAYRGLELRSNVALTYRGLSDRARLLFRLLALVHRSEFAAWTAAALLDTDLDSASDLLDDLTDVQVLQTVAHPGGELMYRLHDLIKVFAQERLQEADSEAERHAAEARLLGGWLALAEQAHRMEFGGDYTTLHGAAPRWTPPGADLAEMICDPVAWWERERLGLLAAIRHAADAGRAELCWDLSLTAVTLFESKGYFDDWRESCTIGLHAADRAADTRGEAAMLYSLGTLHMSQKRLDDALDCLDQALRLFEAAGDAHGQGLALRNAAFIDWLQQRADLAVAKYRAALELLRSVHDQVAEAHVLSNLGRISVAQQDFEQAEQILSTAAQICAESSCQRMAAQVQYRFAELYLSTAQFDRAREMLNQVLCTVRDAGDRIGEAHALYGLGVLRHREGRLDEARSTLTNSLAAAERVGERLVQAQVLYALGELAVAEGQSATAGKHLAEARRLFAAFGEQARHSMADDLLASLEEPETATVAPQQQSHQ